MKAKEIVQAFKNLADRKMASGNVSASGGQEPFDLYPLVDEAKAQWGEDWLEAVISRIGKRRAAALGLERKMHKWFV
ncbi:MAG: hypothetical protein HW403_704 [Dehalococcoidia bacterium]|nr:hypothetical protein [Dehalococcoidia bacterium]